MMDLMTKSGAIERKPNMYNLKNILNTKKPGYLSPSSHSREI